MTDDIVAWLRGVLDEDERGVRVMVETGERVDEAYELADIEAKRAILDAGGPQSEPDLEPSELGDRIQFASWSSATCSDNCGPDVWWAVVRLLASAYRARPGYREEWAPE